VAKLEKSEFDKAFNEALRRLADEIRHDAMWVVLNPPPLSGSLDEMICKE
jgi:hypothetical protein